MLVSATVSAQGAALSSRHQFNGAPFPASSTAEGRQFNGAPFPASATAEGAQLNVPPSLWERGASGQIVFFELAIQCGQGDIQDAGGNLPIASMPLQRLHNSLSFNLGEGSISG